MTFFEGERPLPGWENVELRQLPATPPIEGLWAGTSLLFRRVPVRSPDVMEATDKAFGEVFRAPAVRLWRLRRRLRRLKREPTEYEARTVVQMTRISPAAELDEEWLSSEFDAGLAKLNDYLVTVAAVTQDPAVGPISAQDLPIVVIYLLGDIHEQQPPPGAFLLHMDDPSGGTPISPGQANHIANVVAKRHSEGHPSGYWARPSLRPVGPLVAAAPRTP